jgi:hypothetical protein
VHRLLAHAIGFASLAAFVGFALRGYDTVTIAISVLHVVLWILFVATVWQRAQRGSGDDASVPARRSRVPRRRRAGHDGAGDDDGARRSRSVAEPAQREAVPDAVRDRLPRAHRARPAVRLPDCHPVMRRASLVLIALGALPSTLLYVAASPPLARGWSGRAPRRGWLLVAAGMLLVATDVVRERRVTCARAAGRCVQPR